MPNHFERRFIPYSANQMYDLVADVESYPEFLPWCSGLRICDRNKIGDDCVISTEMEISFKLFREKFASSVTLRADIGVIDVAYLNGPFKYLNSRWKFTDITAGCEVDFSIDFQFKSKLLQRLIGFVFSQAMHRIVRAFEARAKFLYNDN